jgi:hypothetical protein
VVVHSMDRLARNLDDLRRLVQGLTQRGVRIEFVKEHLTFTGEDSPMANLMLSVMGAFAEFERALIRERQRALDRCARAAGVAGAVAAGPVARSVEVHARRLGAADGVAGLAHARPVVLAAGPGARGLGGRYARAGAGRRAGQRRDRCLAPQRAAGAGRGTLREVRGVGSVSRMGRRPFA